MSDLSDLLDNTMDKDIAILLLLKVLGKLINLAGRKEPVPLEELQAAAAVRRKVVTATLTELKSDGVVPTTDDKETPTG